MENISLNFCSGRSDSVLCHSSDEEAGPGGGAAQGGGPGTHLGISVFDYIDRAR